MDIIKNKAQLCFLHENYTEYTKRKIKSKIVEKIYHAIFFKKKNRVGFPNISVDFRAKRVLA